MKKLLSIILAALMVISIIPITVNAAIYSGSCGTNVTWTFDDSTGLFTVSGTGAMNDYYSSEREWLSYKDLIKNVVIEDGVTYVGNFVFFDCNNLETVTIAESVTSMGKSVFAFSENLVKVNIPSGMTSIGNSLFYKCKKLENVTIPDGVTAIEKDAFRYCESLTKVNIPDSVTTLGDSAFQGCINVTDVVIGSGITVIDEFTFDECTSLLTVTMNSVVTEIGYAAFNDCKNLQTVYYAGTQEQWNSITYGVRNNHYIYNEYLLNALIYDIEGNEIAVTGTCGENLTWELLNSTKTLTITGTGKMDAFGMYDCPWMYYKEYIETVIIEDGAINISECAFSSTPSLTSISIPNSVKSIDSDAFSGSNISNITLPDGLEVISSSALASCCLSEINIPDTVTTIGTEAFAYCEELKNIYIPEGVTSIGVRPFYCCTGLTDINVDVNNPNYTSDDGVLFTKDKRVIIQYPTGRTNESYTLPDEVFVIDNGAFSYCDSLKSIVFNDIFEVIGPNAFEDCDGFTSFVIPDTVTKIYAYAFNECRNLADLKLSNNITQISETAFSDCDALTSVVIPDGVTSIGNFAFYSCDNLNSIAIPNTVKSIGNRAFYFSDNLTDVYFYGTQAEWNSITMGTANDNLTNATIHFCAIDVSYVKDQIRYQVNEDGIYAGTFDYRTIVELKNFDNLFDSVDDAVDTSDGDGLLEAGFIFNRGESINLETAKAQISGGEKFYTQVNNSYISTSTITGKYVMACLVKDIPDADKESYLSTVGYVIYMQNGVTKYALFRTVRTSNFVTLYDKYFTQAFPA